MINVVRKYIDGVNDKVFLSHSMNDVFRNENFIEEVFYESIDYTPRECIF